MQHCRRLLNPIVKKLIFELEQFPISGLQDYTLYTKNIHLIDMQTKLHATGVWQYQCVAKSTLMILKWRFTDIKMTVLRADMENETDLKLRLLMEALDDGEVLEEEFLFLYKYNKEHKIEKHVIQDRVPIKKPALLCLK